MRLEPFPPARPEGVSGPTVAPSKWGRARLMALVVRLRSGLLFVAGIAAALVALLIYGAVHPGPAPLTSQDVQQSIAQAFASVTPGPAISAEVYQEIQPSLVLIQAQGTDSEGKTENELGSGVVVKNDGTILTSLHVVTATTIITLTFADGSQSGATIASAQPENDLAMLTPLTPPAKITAAVLGNPNSAQVGDEAYVVGNPFGLYSSLSSGVISGFGRKFQPEGSAYTLDNLIQIDAAVNPGNSGGPLLNRDGEVIGIVAGVVNPTDQAFFVGIGFAVPITAAQNQPGGLPQY